MIPSHGVRPSMISLPCACASLQGNLLLWQPTCPRSWLWRRPISCSCHPLASGILPGGGIVQQQSNATPCEAGLAGNLWAVYNKRNLPRLLARAWCESLPLKVYCAVLLAGHGSGITLPCQSWAGASGSSNLAGISEHNTVLTAGPRMAWTLISDPHPGLPAGQRKAAAQRSCCQAGPEPVHRGGAAARRGA